MVIDTNRLHSNRKGRCGPGAVAAVLVVIHLGLVGFCAARYWFTSTEPGLLSAGIQDWQYGRFDVFRVNPPLVRMWAALPAMSQQPEIPLSGTSPDPRVRTEAIVAGTAFESHGIDFYRWLVWGRLSCLVFVVCGMAVAYRWASQLHGRAAGVGAMLIWTFFPSLIGYECLISGDAQAASLGLVAMYCFRNWLRSPSGGNAYFLGVALGLAALAKSSWMVLFALVPGLWLLIRAIQWLGQRKSMHELAPDDSPPWRLRAREAGTLGLALGVALFVVNLFYGFGGSFQRLDQYEFISRALAGSNDWQAAGFSGNRFKDTWLGQLPVPLPENLVIGIDLQKWDFDRQRWSYFRGQWRDHGWWYYYLYGMAIKTPLGVWVLVALAVIGSVRWRSWRGDWQDELLLLAPLVLVMTAASAETGLNRHLRYVLPVIPLGIVWTSRVFRVFTEPLPKMRLVAISATAWFITSSLWIYPHSLSYFNESVGGPLRAWRHMNASNLSWGQDLTYLRRWQLAHPEARPLWIQGSSDTTSMEILGIESQGRIPALPPTDSSSGHRATMRRVPTGWYVVDQESLIQQGDEYHYLRSLVPVDHAGYGFLIFQITPEIAEELERQVNQSSPSRAE